MNTMIPCILRIEDEEKYWRKHNSQSPTLGGLRLHKGVKPNILAGSEHQLKG